MTDSRDERRERLLFEIEEAIAAYQPELRLVSNNPIVIEGQFCLDDADGCFDKYDVRIEISRLYPLYEPLVTETGGRIPQDADHHNTSGKACICVWEQWLADAEDTSFSAFLEKPLKNYFLGQTTFRLKGEWPFGEEIHGAKGVLAAYARTLDISPDLAAIQSLLSILSADRPKGHRTCFCGSGLRVRGCHREKIDALHGRITSKLARQMAKRLQEVCDLERILSFRNS